MSGVRRDDADITSMQGMGNSLNGGMDSAVIDTKNLKKFMLMNINRGIAVIKALLVIVQPGMEGGNAFADIISGKINPSGKLVDSWAYQYEDYPSAATFSHNNGNVEKEFYEEGIYVGYRYFDTFKIPVRYGFGYGLSYTKFTILEEKIELVDCNNNKNDICRNGNTIEPKREVRWESGRKKAAVTVSIKNIGDVAGKEVIQVYASLPGGNLEKEAHRLVAYAKTDLLRPEETQRITIEIPAERLTSYDENKAAWVLEEGFYGIFVETASKVHGCLVAWS